MDEGRRGCDSLEIFTDGAASLNDVWPFDRRCGARSSCRRLPRESPWWASCTAQLSVVQGAMRMLGSHGCLRMLQSSTPCGLAAGGVVCAVVGHFLRQRQQVRSGEAPPYVLAMLQTGAAAWRSAVVEDMECMFQLLSPKLDALGSPREAPARWEEFVKSWRRQWQTLVALFAEKRKGFKENVAPADITGSGDDEFLCPDCGVVIPTLRKLKCHRGKAHKVRRPAARFVRDGVCPHCRVNFYCRARTMAHLEKGARNFRVALMKGLGIADKRPLKGSARKIGLLVVPA